MSPFYLQFAFPHVARLPPREVIRDQFPKGNHRLIPEQFQDETQLRFSVCFCFFMSQEVMHGVVWWCVLVVTLGGEGVLFVLFVIT